MNKEQEKSLADIMDSAKIYPMSEYDLRRLVSDYNVELDINRDDNSAIIYQGDLEYWFKKGNDNLYYLREE